MSFHLLNNQGLALCSECPYDRSKPVFSFFTNDTCIDVLVIGQSPGRDEVIEGRPFIGRSGQLINSVIKKYTMRVGYINTINCRPLDEDTKKDKMPESTEIRCCRERMYEDIKYAVEEMKPKLILVFGGPAKKEFNRLSKQYPKLNDVVSFQMEHPAYILRNEHLLNNYVQGLHNALKSVFMEKQDIEKSFVTYDDSLKFNFIDDYRKSKIVGFDIETNGLNIFAEDFFIGTMAVSCERHTYFFDYRKGDFRNCEVLIDLLRDEQITKVFADVMYDVVALVNKGVEVNNITDLFPLASLHDNTHYEYSLEAICMRYMPEYATYKAKFKSTVVNNNYLDVDTKSLMIYNCLDSWSTRTLYIKLYAEIQDKARKIFDAIYVKLLPVLVTTKCTGLKIDTDLMNTYTQVYTDRYVQITELFKRKYNITNINSTPQIRKWLFEDLKLKSVRLTKTENKSTDKKVLEHFAEKVPDVRVLYEARRLTSLLTYFLPSINEHIDKGNIIHANYKHYGIQSGRISCKSPNLQGIPRDKTNIKTLDETPLRRMFVARSPESCIMEFDYSQQEVRIVAFLSQDPAMIEAFNRGLDIHRYVASIIFSREYKEVTSFERQVAKGCVFGAIFGVSAKELAESLHVEQKKAERYITKFFDEFPKVKLYIDNQGDIAVRKKEVVSILGMPRKFVVTKFTEKDVRREGANHQIQSVGAAFTFMSLVRIYDRLKKDGLLNTDVLMIHNVHDSIMFDVKLMHVPYMVDTVTKIMSAVPKSIGFTIAYPVDYKIGSRWGLDDLKEQCLGQPATEE